MQSLNRFSFFFSVLIGLVFLFSACGAKKKTTAKELKSSTHHSRFSTSTKKKSKADLVDYYANLLDVKSKDINGDLYYEIDAWMNVPHRLGGMDKSGVDCSGFVSLIYLDVYKKALPRISKDMANHIKRKYDDQLKEGDLVFFSFGGKEIDHVGIYLQNGKFVHVSTKSGVVISNLKDAWYYKYLTRCGTPTI